MKAPHQFLIASSLWEGENHYGNLGMVAITTYLFDKLDHATVSGALDSITWPITVHTVDVDVQVILEKCLSLFKRFSLMHIKKGLDFQDREYQVI